MSGFRLEAVTSLKTMTDRKRCINAAQANVATVLFGSKGHSCATYQE
jgi:hypothetical protein